MASLTLKGDQGIAKCEKGPKNKAHRNFYKGVDFHGEGRHTFPTLHTCGHGTAIHADPVCPPDCEAVFKTSRFLPFLCIAYGLHRPLSILLLESQALVMVAPLMMPSRSWDCSSATALGPCCRKMVVALGLLPTSFSMSTAHTQ